MPQINGPKLFPWQKDVVNAIINAGPHAQKIFVCKSKRQCGKSFMCEMELLRHSVIYPKSTSICVSITYANCVKIFKELSSFIKGAPFVSKINSGALTIEFTNGSEILFKSSQSGDNLRGLTVTGSGLLVLDECAYLPDDIFAIVFPYVNVNRCNILMVSTPRLRAGTFYEYFQIGLNGEDPLIESFDLSQYDTSAVLSPEKIELYRKLLPYPQFVSEVLGDFIDDVGGVFDLTKAIFIPKLNYYDDLFVGLDFSIGNNGDYTVLSGFDSQATQHLLEYTNNSTPANIIDWIVNNISKIDQHKLKALVCETNSIGSVYIDLLKQRLPNVNIVKFTTTNDSKRRIIEYMARRINENRIKFIQDDEQKKQLGAYQMELTSTGKVTYNGAPGTHDDCCMAAAFALSEIDKLEQRGSYNISFGTTNRNKNIRRHYD